MFERHLTSDLLAGFCEGRLSKEENSLVVRHLLRRCESCRPILESVSASHPLFRGEPWETEGAAGVF